MKPIEYMRIQTKDAFRSSGDITKSGHEMKELYTKEIMSYAAHIPHIGTIDGASGVGSAHSRLCGSRISVSLNMKNGLVSEFAQQVKACLVGQASASMIAHNIIGTSKEELAEVREQVRVMLEEGGEPPTGKWAAYALLEPVRNYKSRYSTVLIAFDATLEAIDMALANSAVSEERENV